MLDENPLVTVSETVTTFELPNTIATLVGLTLIAKSGLGGGGLVLPDPVPPPQAANAATAVSAQI